MLLLTFSLRSLTVTTTLVGFSVNININRTVNYKYLCVNNIINKIVNNIEVTKMNIKLMIEQRQIRGYSILAKGVEPKLIDGSKGLSLPAVGGSYTLVLTW